MGVQLFAGPDEAFGSHADRLRKESGLPPQVHSDGTVGHSHHLGDIGNRVEEFFF